MNLLKDYSFRDLLNKYIYIENKAIRPILSNYFDTPEEATGLLAYCYLEHEKGISLEVLCCSYFDEAAKSIKFYNTNDEARIALPYTAMLDSRVLILPDNILPLEKFLAKVNPLLTLTHISEGVEKSRKIAAIDHLRKVDNPDAVLVQLVHGDEHIEGHLALLEDVGEMNLTGTLLSEPEFAFGIHQGESLTFFLVRNEKGVMCLAML